MEDFLKAALPKIPTLAGLKFSSRDMYELGRCLVLDKERVQILFGGDEVGKLQVQGFTVSTHCGPTLATPWLTLLIVTSCSSETFAKGAG